jgi:hypothetical protein
LEILQSGGRAVDLKKPYQLFYRKQKSSKNVRLLKSFNREIKYPKQNPLPVSRITNRKAGYSLT